MPQTFYIESDEEIISVIGRLRKSSSEENTFVFPKRALVLQSIVNLRLLRREADKLGKKVVIISQDETGRKMAEKAGLETGQYSEENSQNVSHVEIVNRKAVAAEQHDVPSGSSLLRSESIGSSEFNASPQSFSSVPQDIAAPGKSLRIRNATPHRLTSLNSLRDNGESQRKGSVAPFRPLPSAQTAYAPKEARQSVAALKKDDRGERLRNFFNGNHAPYEPVAEPKKPEVVKRATTSISGKKAHTIFLVLGGISIVSLLGVITFLFLPTAEIKVTPYKSVQRIDVELEGRANQTGTSEGHVLPVRLIEKETDMSVTVATTGKASSANQKARGTVIIYNQFSTEPQTLVATTRLETPDGKLFRLTETIVVPGMTSGQEPGAIEAHVIADQAGEEYNIGPSEFSIPGFKGGPKFAKFSAKSTKNMIGGGSGGSGEVSVITKADLDTAERETRQQILDTILSSLRSELQPDEKVLEDQIEIAPLNPAALPQIGTAANTFDYSNRYKVRAFIFSEKIVSDKIAERIPKTLHEIPMKPISQEVTYSDSQANHAEGIVEIKATALVTLESDVDADAFRDELLGQDESGIKQILDQHPEIKKIEVVFRPQWILTSVPESENRVQVIMEPGEE